MALGDDGLVVAEHLCTDVPWCKYELGVTSDRKHELYNEHFGAGNWRLVWLDNPYENDGFMRAKELLARSMVG
jgi:hypothetical protein